ncbi:O-antigen ligase family protein [Devosia riboflavina]
MWISIEATKQQIAGLLAGLVLMGYPFIGTLVEVTGLPHQWLTYPYRGVMACVCLVAIIVSIRPLRVTETARPVMAFLALYSVRLVFDWLVVGHPYAAASTTFFLVTVLLPTVAVILALRRPFEESSLVYLILGIGIPVVAAAIALLIFRPDITITGRISYFALNSISLARASAVVLLAGLVLAMRSESVLRIAALEILIVAATIVVLYANSRGPLLAMAVAVLYLLATNWRRVAFFVPMLSVIAFWFILDVGDAADIGGHESIGGRLSQVVEGVDELTGIRLHLFRSAIDAFMNAPLVGAYFTDPTKDVSMYPHNIVLQTAVAMGVVGLSALAYLVFTTLRAAYRIAPRYPLMVSLLLQAAALSMVSGSIWGSSDLFVLVAMVCCLAGLQVQQRSELASPSALPV